MLEVVRISKNLIYLKDLFEELGMKFLKSTIILTDAQIVLDNIMSDTLSRKSRHFITKVNLVKDIILDKNFVVTKVEGTNNIADIGTKPLPRDTFEKYQSLLFNEELLLEYLRRCVRYMDAKQIHSEQTCMYTADHLQVVNEYNEKHEDDVEKSVIADTSDRSQILIDEQDRMLRQDNKHN